MVVHARSSTPTTEIPDVCDVVEYSGLTKGATYRVTGWLKPHAPAPRISGLDMLIAGAMWSDLSQKQREDAITLDVTTSLEKPKGVRLVWCPRQEATHLCLTGVCGAVAAISACKVVGRVNWSEETVSDAVAHAMRLGALGEVTDVYR